MLRETVRRLLSEAGMGDVRVAEPRPAPKLGFGDLRVADSYVEPPGANSFDSLLSWIEGLSDLAGVAANVSKDPRFLAVNVLADVVSFLSATVQWSNAIDRHEKVISIKNKIHPDQRDQVLEAYRTARNLSFFLLTVTCVAWAASTADMLKFKGPGSAIEIAAKAAKLVMPAIAVLNKSVDTDTIYRDTERFMIDTASYVAGPMFKDAATAAAVYVERNAKAIDAVLRRQGHADIADKMKMVLDEIPEHRAWLSTK